MEVCGGLAFLLLLSFSWRSLRGPGSQRNRRGRCNAGDPDAISKHNRSRAVSEEWKRLCSSTGHGNGSIRSEDDADDEEEVDADSSCSSKPSTSSSF